MGKRENFSDRLTPRQVQKVFDELRIPWRESNYAETNGWANISQMSFNVMHGGYVNWIDRGKDEHYDFEGLQVGDKGGDIVNLVGTSKFFGENNADKKAIEWIKKVLGWNITKPPELDGGFEFPKDVLGNGNFVQVSKSLLESDLKATEKIVWMAIYGRCYGDHIYASTGVRTISKDAGTSKSTVQRSLEKLSAYNLIIEKPRWNIGPNKNNKAPQRFPIIAPTETINKRIKIYKAMEKKNQTNAKQLASRDQTEHTPRVQTGTPLCSDWIHNNSFKNKNLKNTKISLKSNGLALSFLTDSPVPVYPRCYQILFLTTFMAVRENLQVRLNQTTYAPLKVSFKEG
jgi:hypothetical protein